MSVVAFPGECRPHVEVIEARERGTGRKLWIFDMVGSDADGPYRVDVAHRFSPEDVAADVALWRAEGVEVRGV